jgi:hypothetical protein
MPVHDRVPGKQRRFYLPKPLLPKILSQRANQISPQPQAFQGCCWLPDLFNRHRINSGNPASSSRDQVAGVFRIRRHKIRSHKRQLSLIPKKELSHSKKRKGVNLYSSRLFKISIPKASKAPIENRVLQGRVKATA